MAYEKLNAENAFIWRITHRKNMPWILQHGIFAGNSSVRSSCWLTIGNKELISRRARHEVPLSPGGTLNDYVPFYFTPFSPMMYNIHTGRGGVSQVANDDVVILVSKLAKIAQEGGRFLFTDRHAYTAMASYYDSLADLGAVDWSLLRARDFRRSEDDPERVERYQAEALVWNHVPVAAFMLYAYGRG